MITMFAQIRLCNIFVIIVLKHKDIIWQKKTHSVSDAIKVCILD